MIKVKNFKSKSFLLFLSFLCFGPMLVLISKSFVLSSTDESTWSFLVSHVVPELLKNTFVLSIGSLVGATLIGTFCSFLIVFTDIPGKKFWHPLFILPLAFPLYVMAFIYVGMLDYSGPLQTFFREDLDISLSWLRVRSLVGSIFLFSVCLSPYVYLFTRNAFRSVDRSLIMSSRSLGYSPWKTVLKMVLPYSFPWILSAGIIVAMETLADFGAVSALNVDTFTTAIYSAWSGFFSLSTAARLSCLLMLIAGLMFSLEKYFNSKGSYASLKNNYQNTPLIRLSFFQKVFMLLLAGGLSLVSLILPLGQLLIWVVEALELEWSNQYPKILLNTMIIGILASLTIALISFLMTYTSRRLSSTLSQTLTSFSLFGYALPGNIIAVAVFLYFTSIQNSFGFDGLGTGSLFILIVGLGIRFLSIGHRPQEGACQRVSSSIEKAARNLGAGHFRFIKTIHFPLLSRAFLISTLLIFIEVVKEMPLTLMLRPFHMNTLAVKIFELTSEGEWERASISALFLVILGSLGVFLMGKLESERQ